MLYNTVLSQKLNCSARQWVESSFVILQHCLTTRTKISSNLFTPKDGNANIGYFGFRPFWPKLIMKPPGEGPLDLLVFSWPGGCPRFRADVHILTLVVIGAHWLTCHVGDCAISTRIYVDLIQWWGNFLWGHIYCHGDISWTLSMT